MSAAAAAAAAAPVAIAGDVPGPDGGAAGGRKVGEKDKRVQPNGTTAELSTVAGWTEAKTWVWGLHPEATTDEKRTASRYVKNEWTIFCRGCGKQMASSSQTWARHVALDSCIVKRADPKNHFTGMMLTMLRPTGVTIKGKRVGRR